MAKVKIEEIPVAELQGQAQEVADALAIAATVPTSDPDRATRIKEQIVTRSEEQARATTAPKLRCSSCGATFVTSDAADLHVDSFHPTDEPDRAATETAIPVKVVSEPKSRGAKSEAKAEKIPAKEQQA